jgi:hypothetical protein
MMGGITLPGEVERAREVDHGAFHCHEGSRHSAPAELALNGVCGSQRRLDLFAKLSAHYSGHPHAEATNL